MAKVPRDDRNLSESDNDSQESIDRTESGTQPTCTVSREKRRRGQRSQNQLPRGIFPVTEVGPKGEPLEPFVVRAKFRNAIGALVRQNMDITIDTWRNVPAGTKQRVWDEIVKIFIFPPEEVNRAKEYALKQLGISFRNWKSWLNTNYAQKGLSPRMVHEKITEAQLAESDRRPCPRPWP